MKLARVEDMPSWERIQLQQFADCVEQSPHLDNLQKGVVERLLQEIVDVFNKEPQKEEIPCLTD